MSNSKTPTVQFNAPRQRESIGGQIEIPQVFWQNAVVFLSAKSHGQNCITNTTKPCFFNKFNLSVSVPAPTRADSSSLQAPSPQTARPPHQAGSLTSTGENTRS